MSKAILLRLDCDVSAAGLFWTAPEILRNPLPPPNGTQKADVYSVGILLYNILYRLPPFHTNGDIVALPRGIYVTCWPCEKYLTIYSAFQLSNSTKEAETYVISHAVQLIVCCVT